MIDILYASADILGFLHRISVDVAKAIQINYCDFIVWNENDIYIERVTPDVAFWDCIVPKVELFLRQCILPEVLGKVFSKPLSTTTLQVLKSDDIYTVS